MARPKKSLLDLPKYRLHRGSGNAVVELSGKTHYLGTYGSPESLAKYHALIAAWGTASPSTPPPSTPTSTSTVVPVAPAAPDTITVSELVDRFLLHADSYYRHPDGTPTAETWAFSRVVKPLLAMFGRMAADAFRPTALKLLRDELMKVVPSAKSPTKQAGYRVRTAVNKDISRVRMIFSWGVENELVKPETYGALRLVKGLRAYRCEAPESEAVRPVPIKHVTAIKPYVSRQIWALVELQRLTGARPGELVLLRPVDIDTTTKPWAFSPSMHKTAHHGHRRTIYFGPKAQGILEAFIKGRKIDAFLFNPKEAERERHAKAEVHRRRHQKPNAKKTGRKVRDRYDREGYARAIARACRKANVPPWHPNQLRHLAATELRRKFGIEAAQTILGHRLGSAITEVYAESNADKARGIIRRIG